MNSIAEIIFQSVDNSKSYFWNQKIMQFIIFGVKKARHKQKEKPRNYLELAKRPNPDELDNFWAFFHTTDKKNKNKFRKESF